ncbi:endonuclease/exonuclease/phosphatase family protein, partial [Agrobacterium sp.]|uniref:endonuclease/exonuclease/phosphatase family protein n=1 Tax=Agrobacterium sp. TaxID=361 RepID=UPI0040340042
MPRPRPTGLRLATHNVSGLTSISAVFTLVKTWVDEGLDIICLQETWIGRPTAHGSISQQQAGLWLNQATSALHSPPFHTFWANNHSSHSHAGVAILVRSDLPITLSNHSALPCGRLQSLSISWAGHSFLLLNSYWPSTGAVDRATFLTQTLAPLLLPSSLPLCLVGDFNFTPLPNLDRLPSCHTTTLSDNATTTLLSSLLPSHSDIYRQHHPTGRSFTFHRGHHHLARLDRIYLPPQLSTFSHSASCHFSPRGDHHAVSFLLLPASPLQPRGPGRHPIPCSMATNPTASPHLTLWARKAVTFGLTLSSADLISWWPTLQKAFKTFAHTLLPLTKEHDHRALVTLNTTHHDLTLAHSAVATALPDTLPHALNLVAQAFTSFRQAHSASTSHLTRDAHSTWLHHREQPSPLLTSLIHPPTTPTSIPSLRSPGGEYLTSNRSIATALGAHFSRVSAQPLTNPHAQRAVITALQLELTKGTVHLIPPTLAGLAGAADITVAEVLTALTSCPSTSSPGPDGLPYNLWRVDGDCWAPLIAKLFTAIGTTGTLPTGFNRGTITPIPKPSAPNLSNPTSYRPITLLPSLYRLLAKILAARFGKAMAPAIG